MAIIREPPYPVPLFRSDFIAPHGAYLRVGGYLGHAIHGCLISMFRVMQAGTNNRITNCGGPAQQPADTAIGVRVTICHTKVLV